MTRIKFFLAAAVATLAAATPFTQAQTLRIVAAGSSARWPSAGIYSAIQSLPGVRECGFGGGGQCTYHYTAAGNKDVWAGLSGPRLVEIRT